MRVILTAGLILSAVAFGGCGGHGVKIDPDARPLANRWNATLSTPAGLAGALQVRGTGWIGPREKDATKSEAYVAIENAPPGGEHPWHVHVGQCGSDQGIYGPADAYPLLKVGGNGKADATAKLDLPMPATGQYFINVHASRANMGTIVACGNLAPPAQ